MTQRIFDVENEKDMADLWEILPASLNHIHKYGNNGLWDDVAKQGYLIINIKWHNKTTLSRPIQEATEADVGKLCLFWDYEDMPHYGVLRGINKESIYRDGVNLWKHCRRLTKQEIEEIV